MEESDVDFDDEEVGSSENEGSIIEALEKESSEPKKRKHSDEFGLHRKRRKEYVRPPTVQELNQLRETENLFNSNLFRLQIEEMLQEMAMKEKHQKLFTKWLDDFKSFVLKLDTSEEYDLFDKKWLKGLGVKPPIVLKPPNEKGKFKFICPENVTVGGSYSIRATLGPVYSIDLHLHVPSECFQKSDQINLRFDRKRALYLAMLADALSSSNLIQEISFVQAHGCPMKPILELQPSGKLGQYIRVLLWPVTSPNVLLLTRLRPARGNIRSHWFLGTPAPPGEDVLEPPSPHYNSGVAQDIMWRQNQEMLEHELSAPSLQAGLILLKVWLRQRKLDKGSGSFGGFVLAMYLVYLVQQKRLNKMMSCYQVARITWNCLAQSDWTTEGISLSSSASGPPISDFQNHFDVVFVDVSGFCNLCANVRRDIYLQVKEESARAVMFLDSSSSSSFQALFMTPIPFEQCYDHLIRFHDTAALATAAEARCTAGQRVARGGWLLPQVQRLLLPPLLRGLGQRAASVVMQPPDCARWPCSKRPPSLSKLPPQLLTGVRLNPSYAFEKLEKGPPADQPEAEEFRVFWGNLSQLRRFRDGSICEAVLWSDSRPVCEQILQYVLKEHTGLNHDAYLYIANLPKIVLRLPKAFPKTLPEGEVAFQTILASFDTLTKQLRALPELTLCVNAVQGISPLFRYAEVFPPLPICQMPKSWVENTENSRNSSLLLNIPKEKINKMCVPRYCAPVESVMTLEHSGKWPRNLEAVRRLKAALCIQMAALMQKQYKLATQPHVDHVDIFKDGFVFRIWLAARKEVILMKEHVNALGLLSYRDTPEALALEEKIDLLPKFSSALHGLHQQFPGFGPTAQIAKRWLSSQFIGPPHLPELVTELLVAHIFLSPEPFHRPVQSQLGLLHFLRLVSSTDWHTTPLIVNFNSEFTRERIAELETQFHSSRNTLPALFIATPYDRSVSQCTRLSPTLQILIRLGTLASAALKELQVQLLESSHPDCLPVFRPDLDNYDAKIYLRSHCVSRIYEAVDKQRKELFHVVPYVPSEEEKIPIVDFDPVQRYLAELRCGYSDIAMFFHDQHGGSVIGVVWKPSVMQEKDFKISIINGHKVANKKSKVILNMDAILEDFFSIGQGLVKSIDNKHGEVSQLPRVSTNGIT